MKLNQTPLCVRSLTLHTTKKHLRIALFLFLLLTVWKANAQSDMKEIERKYNVKIDSVFLKATPYKQIERDGIIYDEDKKIDWYNDITIYEIKPNQTNQKTSAKRSSGVPAVFMIPGGGFFSISPVDSLQMDPDIPSTVTFGGKLVDSLGVNVYVISYEITPDALLGHLVFPTEEFNDYEHCKRLKHETARAKMLEASYKSFRDLRKILKVNYLDSAAIKGIDPDNFFMIGSSAGAILTLNTLFLQQSEIPSSITYKTQVGIFCPTDITETLHIDTSIRNHYWPIPQMKGVISMAGAWIYEDSLLTANTPYSTYDTWLFLLHGTCDEIVHRREGRIGFKKIKLIPPSYIENDFPANRFLKGYGSEIIFNAFKTSHIKLRYGQVLGGGHTPFHNSTYTTMGAWEVETTGTNTVNPLSDQVFPFLDTLIQNDNLWGVSANTWLPEAFTTHCKPFDEPLDTICYFPLGIMYGVYICDETRTALYFNPPPPPFTTDWSVKGNLTILSTTDTTLVYKRTAPIGSLDTITLKVTRPCGSNEREVYSISAPSSCGDFFMEPGSDIYLNVNNTFIPFEVLDLSDKSEQKLTAIYYNAVGGGVTELDWVVPCMYITEPPQSFLVGEHLVSHITVKRNSHLCGSLKVHAKTAEEHKLTIAKHVRNERENQWAIGLSPNPAKDHVVVKLNNSDTQKTTGTYPLTIVDTRGIIRQNTVISDGRAEINVSHLEPGTYKVVVQAGGEVVFATLSIFR